MYHTSMSVYDIASGDTSDSARPRQNADHVQSLWGLTAGLHTKLAAHARSICLNRRIDHPNPLQIKHLAFSTPN